MAGNIPSLVSPVGMYGQTFWCQSSYKSFIFMSKKYTNW